MILRSFYLDLMARLVTPEVGVEHFDLFNQQFARERDGDTLPFNLPAVFLEFEPFDWETVGRNRQQADVPFTLIVGSLVQNEHDSDATDQERTSALQHLDLLDRITVALQNASGTGWGSVNRTGMTPDHNHDGVYVHTMRFRSRLTDTVARDTWERADPQPSQAITINLQSSNP